MEKSRSSNSFTSRLNRTAGNLVFGVPFTGVLPLLPGIAGAAVLAWASVRFAEFLGQTILGFEKSPVSSVMVAVLLGMLIGNSPIPLKIFKPGFTFTVKKLLRIGIMLLGLRLSITEAARFGSAGIPVIVACIAGALLFTGLAARLLDISPRLGTLIAVGTSICGVSAIAAAGPAIDAKGEEISYAVAVITVFGILATLLYPFAGHIIFQGSGNSIGIFLGTAIHDTSQVTGAALVYEQVYSTPGVLNAAAVTKLVRNLFMVAVIPLISIIYRNRDNRKKDASGDGAGSKDLFSGAPGKAGIASMVPLFIAGFVLFSVVRSLGDAGIGDGAGLAFGVWTSGSWKSVYSGLSGFGQNCIVAALAGVGLTTSFRSIKSMGMKPFAAGLGAALMVGILSFAVISIVVR